MKLYALMLLVLCGAAAAQDCGDQNFLPIVGQIDPNMVAVDPWSGQRLLVLVAKAKVGKVVTITGRACDPDGDPMDCTIEVPGDPNSLQLLRLNQDGTFEIQVTRASRGIEYRWVTATDHPDPNDPSQDITVRGTYAVWFHGAPVLSGYVASIADAIIMKSKQFERQVARKLR